MPFPKVEVSAVAIAMGRSKSTTCLSIRPAGWHRADGRSHHRMADGGGMARPAPSTDVTDGGESPETSRRGGDARRPIVPVGQAFSLTSETSLRVVAHSSQPGKADLREHHA